METLDSLTSCPPEEIDIEAIMAQVRLNVAEKRRAKVYVDEFLPPPMGVARNENASLDEHLRVLRASCSLPIEGDPIHSHRPISGFFIKAFKKLTRFWTRKYTDALFLRQNYFNAELVATLEAMKDELEQLRALRGELEQLRQRRLRESQPPDSGKLSQ